MLTTLLTDGAASPMYRALIESNIGNDYSASTGYDRTCRMTNVSFGLQGIKSDNVSLVCVFKNDNLRGYYNIRKSPFVKIYTI